MVRSDRRAPSAVRRRHPPRYEKKTRRNDHHVRHDHAFECKKLRKRNLSNKIKLAMDDPNWKSGRFFFFGSISFFSSALSRRRRRHVYRASIDVPVLKMSASPRRSF